MSSSPIRLVPFALPLVLALAGCGGGRSEGDDELGDSEDDGIETSVGESADDASGTDQSDQSDQSDQTDQTADDDDGGVGPKFDVLGTPDGGGDDCAGGDIDNAMLTGTVYAPNGVIPVAGALVYITNSAPEGIPDQVYCAECVELPCGTDFVETEIDGTFSLGANAGPGKYLVVQKGQFLRVTPYDVPLGNTQLPEDMTELPGEWNPANGLYIPKIAVADGSYDRLEDALGKMGLGDTMISNMEERLVPGTESFELWDNGRNPTTDGFVSQGNLGQLVGDPTRLSDYHIIFVPCSSDGYLGALNQQGIDNVREWVAAGGRWYVADWANEWLSTTFPEYQNFYGGGDADLGSYDSLADVLDMGLLDWLTALPGPLKNINPLNDEQHPTLLQLPKVPTVDNWSGIQYPLPEILVEDDMGNMVDVGHKVWLEGPGDGFEIPANANHPLTITGQYGCGKIQFTSYHAAEFFNYVGLSPQELVLIYTILEIGVCQDALPPPAG
ncbi:hypothetical protein ACNOYE_09870 [Nannocystaceae bacterium ST9]